MSGNEGSALGRSAVERELRQDPQLTTPASPLLSAGRCERQFDDAISVVLLLWLGVYLVTKLWLL